MKFRKKSPEFEAIQWNKHGDHVAVVPATMEQAAGLVPGLLWEHAGWLGSMPGCIVKPGTWIVRNQDKELSMYDQNVFEQLYEPVTQHKGN